MGVGKLLSFQTMISARETINIATSNRLRQIADWLEHYATDHTHTGGPDGAPLIKGVVSGDNRTFTNTSFLDLDALTGGGGSIGAVTVTIESPDSGTAIVWLSGFIRNGTGGSETLLGYRISGVTTLAASNVRALRYESSNDNDFMRASFVHVQTGINEGSNVFELQAAVSGNTGTLGEPALAVMIV